MKSPQALALKCPPSKKCRNFRPPCPTELLRRLSTTGFRPAEFAPGGQTASALAQRWQSITLAASARMPPPQLLRHRSSRSGTNSRPERKSKKHASNSAFLSRKRRACRPLSEAGCNRKNRRHPQRQTSDQEIPAATGNSSQWTTVSLCAETLFRELASRSRLSAGVDLLFLSKRQSGDHTLPQKKTRSTANSPRCRILQKIIGAGCASCSRSSACPVHSACGSPPVKREPDW